MEYNIEKEQQYDKHISDIYSFNDDIELDFKDLQYYHKKGYLLAHHVIQSFNDDLISKFINQNLNKLNTYLTKNYILNTNGFKIVIVENQSILHIAAFNNIELYFKLKTLMLDTPDYLGYFAEDYFQNRNQHVFLSKINNIILSKFGVHFEPNNMIVDNYDNIFIKNDLLKFIKESNVIKPNSMHNYGHNLNDLSIIKKLINLLNNRYSLNLDDKIYQISAFTAEYGNNTNNNLDLHKDNSTITINWNLEIDPDIQGSELVFPTLNKEIKINNSMLIIHHGKIEHYVKPLIKGNRINLIIWIQ
jgi:hypothetical protein